MIIRYFHFAVDLLGVVLAFWISILKIFILLQTIATGLLLQLQYQKLQWNFIMFKFSAVSQIWKKYIQKLNDWDLPLNAFVDDSMTHWSSRGL